MTDEARTAEAEGSRGVYSIPTGGSTPVGALGYVRGVQELISQLDSAAVDAIRATYFASGSGGTHAGMVVGAWLAGWRVRCVGAEIDPISMGADGVSPFQRAIVSLTQQTSDLIGLERHVSLADIELDASCTGPAYGAETEEGREAARLLFRTEGILLDPVYTAKAFAALLGSIRRGSFAREDTVLFWHTGGAAGIFAAH